MLQSNYPTYKGVLRISRKSFLAEMKNLLTFMDSKDRERALARYDELFDTVGPDNEEALIAALGSAVRQVLSTEKELREAQKKGIVPFTTPLPIPEGLRAAPAAETPAEETAAPVPAENAPEESFVRAAAGVLEDGGLSVEDSREAITAMEEDFPLESLIPPGEPPLSTAETVFPKIIYDIFEQEQTIQPDSEPAVMDIPAVQTADELLPEAPSAGVEVTAPPEAISPPEEVPALTSEPVTPASEAPAIEPVKPAPETKAVRPNPAPAGPGTGRVFAAVLVTFPFILLWAASFAVFLALGLIAMALGFAVCAAGIYFTTYVTQGKLAFMPDTLLVAGVALVSFALALLLIWMGLWIAVGGIASVIHWTSGVYRSILRRKVPRKGGAQ